MEFSIEQLSSEVLKSVFDAAFLETGIDEDGDLYVKDEYRIWVRGMPTKDCFGFSCFMGIGEEHSREKLLECCNRFNMSYLGLKVSAMDSNDSLLFQYQTLIKSGGKIEGKEIVRLLRYFQEVIRDSLDDEEVFDFG